MVENLSTDKRRDPPSRCIPCPACGGRAYIRRSAASANGDKVRYCTCAVCLCTFVTVETLSHIAGFSESFSVRTDGIKENDNTSL